MARRIPQGKPGILSYRYLGDIVAIYAVFANRARREIFRAAARR